MSELLNRFPDANLLDLTEEQRLFAIEGFVALELLRQALAAAFERPRADRA